MRLSLRPLMLTTLLATTACLGAASSGCIITSGDHGGGGYTPPDNEEPTETAPQVVTIDADATIQAVPGDGVGVFVEYSTGGHWNVFTTCDFNAPENGGNYSCGFDVFATVLDEGATIDNPKGQDLAGQDQIELLADGSVHLYTENTLGLGGIRFDTPVGATVQLEVYLDGYADPHYIYWVGKEVLHQGAPTNPLNFQPSETTSAPTDPPSTDPPSSP
ncbi:hypothetical protein A7982_12130 [Minicystis rosea]|nr:hypothetical protein A7982_12130 [Minicystis rosea]